MRPIIILEEKNLLSDYLLPARKFFEDGQIRLERVSLGNLKDLPNFAKNTVVLWEIGGSEKLFQLTLDYLKDLSASIKVVLVCDFSRLGENTLEQVKTLCRSNKKIHSIMDMKNDVDLYLPMLRDLHTRDMEPLADSQDKEVLLELKKELDQVAKTVETELNKVKRLHENILPKRFSEIKGIQILSKYSVGDSPGGEFFDIIYKNRKIAIILSSSSSYVFSGMLLGQFSNLKKEPSLGPTELHNFMINVGKDCTGFGPAANNPGFVQLFVALIDLKTLAIEGHNFGQSMVLSQSGITVPGNQHLLQESFFDKAHFQIKLRRGEKIMLLSPGVRKNTQDLIKGGPLVDFLQNLFMENSFDILNELFFQLKKDKDNDFLRYDASSIIVEVNKNVLVQA